LGDKADAAHEAAAIRADSGRLAGVFVCLWLGVRLAGGVVGLAGRLDLKQVAHPREGLASVTLGEEAVVTDAVEAVGQNVEEKAADQLVRGQPHDAASAAAAIVLVGKRRLIVVDGDEPRMGDRRAMGVAGEIGQHALGTAERRLGVDDEGAVAERAPALGESGGRGERGRIAEETEFAAAESGVEAVEDQAAEGLRQGADGEQEVGFAGDPTLTVEGAAAGDETVNVGMMGQRLSPGVQDGDEADFGAAAFGGEGHERLGRCAHQEAIDDLFVLEGDLGCGRRQGEDDVEVWNRQQLGLTSGEPLRSRRPLTLRAMAVSTRVIGDAGEPAGVAALDMTAERRRAAGRDRADHAPFDPPEMSGVRSFVSLAVAAEDVGRFERRPNLHRTISAASRSARVDRADWPYRRSRRSSREYGASSSPAWRGRGGPG